MNKEVLLNLKEDNKIESKYAEIISIVILISSIIIFSVLTKYTDIISNITLLCIYYTIAKLLSFFTFGTRNKRRKDRILINKLLKSI